MILSTEVGRKRARVVAVFAAVPFAALSALGVATSATASQPSDDHKVTYCHATHSATNPFVIVTSDKVGVVRAHQNHQDLEDVIPEFDWWLAGQSGHFAGQGDDPEAFIANGCVAEEYPS
ncbi:hypothetical protein E3T54_05605 [Cryobacterium sp. Sr8]|uniref:hypothetical protein n=1 Tax=Cryobacterium sp. Sr8 TaxID=1259203 RepID=UPI001069E0BF|nr:hypothetical protein [Cryobacterium sp. Sr8]TFD78990.1 hypothetical protein E3T54_05605 [Cryobacterium sp. Sr8]